MVKKQIAPTVKQVKVGIYTRVSTDEQTEGYGLDVQIERTRAQAVAKGWVVVGEYQDAGISGTKDETERPGLNNLLEAACNGEIDAVIVMALDRLGRNTRLVLTLVEKLTNCGVELVSCKEALDTSTPTGRFMLSIFAALTELERDTIKERTSAGREQRGKTDGERGGRLPMGYARTADGSVTVDSHRAAVVQTIFNMKAQGKPLRAIAAHLNAEHHITPRSGGDWYASSVREVLLNESKYRGGLRGGSDVRWPQILTN